MNPNHPDITFREPTVQDGITIHQLVKDSQILDLNSLYSYLIIAEHFGKTSIVTEDSHGKVMGYISAYIPPDKNEVIFVWQVVVHNDLKGKGIAKSMLLSLLKRQRLEGVRYLETTYTPSNTASRALFYSLAKTLSTECQEHVLFPSEVFGSQNHEEERLISIGPFDGKNIQKTQ